MDGGVARRLTRGVRELLLIEDADAEGDDRAEHDDEERQDQCELHQCLPAEPR